MPRPRFSDRAAVRSERTSLVLKPMTLDGIRTLATIQDVSTNDLIASILDSIVERNQSVIDEFKAEQSAAAKRIDLSTE